MDEYMGDFLFHTFQPFRFCCDDFVDYVIPEKDDESDYLSKQTKDLEDKIVRFEVVVKMLMLVFCIVSLHGFVCRQKNF